MRRLFALLLGLCLLFGGCGLLPEPAAKPAAASERTVFAMDTVMELRVYGDTDGVAMDRMAQELSRLDAELSATREDSALSALNRTGQTDNYDLFYLAGQALEICARSGGALDITLLPASRLWGFPAKDYRVPDPAELEALRAHTGMDKLHPADGAVTVDAGTELDLGALGKGYAGDLCTSVLRQRNLAGILSLGGNIMTFGTKPDGSDWVIGVQDPDDPGAYALTLRLAGSRAIVTSGDYQRYFEEDGVRYCHILDPETLRPAESGLRAVTVVADSGTLADGLSTALFVLGLEKGTALWRESEDFEAMDFEAIWITADGGIYLTEGLKDAASGASFTLVSKS